jgi:hypothetical protein
MGAGAARMLRMPLVTIGINLATVIAPPLSGIGQQAVSGRHLLEAFLVAGGVIRVKFLGEPAVCLLEVVGGGRLRHTQCLIRIAHFL